MKLKFKHQRFQEEAAKAVCDVFAGQPYRQASYMIDPGQLRAGESEMSKPPIERMVICPP